MRTTGPIERLEKYANMNCTTTPPSFTATEAIEIAHYIGRLKGALLTAANRFEDKRFGCNWPDAAEDCRAAVKGRYIDPVS